MSCSALEPTVACRDREGEEAPACLRNREPELGDLVTRGHPPFDRVGRDGEREHARGVFTGQVAGWQRRGVDRLRRMSVRRVIVDHVLFVVGDLAPSRRLYTAALAPLGYEELYVQEDCVSYGAEDLDDFTICQGEPVTTAAHVAFSVEGREEVDAFFEAAIANGATILGEPGVWTQYSERYYAAFVNDLHQNNVEAVWHAPDRVIDAPHRPGVP